MDIRTLIFLDLETTGLPMMEHNRTKMTELCLVAVESSHIRLGVTPRVQNKLSLCLNPRKFISPESTSLTGLANDLLENQSEFNQTTCTIIRQFLDIQEKPICFIAHNGYRFDYPILRAELNRISEALPDDILCADSLIVFRQLHNEDVNASLKEQNVEESTSHNDSVDGCIQTESTPKELPFEFQNSYDDFLCSIADEVEKKYPTSPLTEMQKLNETTPRKRTVQHNQAPKKLKYNVSNEGGLIGRRLFGSPSFKLEDLYMRLTAKPNHDAHRAECDVNMLIECAATAGDRFVNWCNVNSVKFYDIPMMQVGRPIGT